MKHFYSVLLVLLLAALGQPVWAQTAASYQFTTGSWRALEDMSTGTTTAIGSGSVSSAAANSATAIGFTFPFAGATYTQCWVNAAGVLRLGATSPGNSFSLPAAATVPGVAAFASPAFTGTDGYVRYKVVGTAPARRLVMEWFVGTGQNFSASRRYQVLLHEGGAIELLYASFFSNSQVNVGVAASATDYQSVNLPSNTASSTAVTNNAGYTVPAGTVYRFEGPTVPTVSTTAVTTVATTTATLGGDVTASGGPALTVTGRGVVYSSTNTTPAIAGSGSTQDANGSGTGTFTKSITGLTSGTVYYVRAYAINGLGTSYGSVVSFTTTPAPPVVTAPANGGQGTTTPTYRGTAAPNSLVRVFVDGSTVTATTTTDAAGNWSAAQPSALAVSGSHTVRARAQLNASPFSAYSSTNTFTVDMTVPTVSLSSSAGANGSSTGTSPLPFAVTFSENVTGFDALDLTVSNGTVSGFTTVSGTSYTFNVAPTASGTVTVNMAAGVASDLAGNGNTAAPPFTFTYTQPVTAAPVVTTPANGSLATDNTPTYTGTAPAGSLVTVYSDGAAFGTTTATGGNWTFTSTSNLTDGPHTVYATAQLSGQAVSATSNTNTFAVDTVPTVSLSSSAGSSGGTTTTSPIPFTVTFSENVSGFSPAGLTVTNGTAANLSGSGASYTVEVMPTAAGLVTVRVVGNAAQDAAGNGNDVGPTFSLTYNLPGLVINTGTLANPVAVAAGTYNHITVQSPGVARLDGATTVNTTVTVEAGATLLTNCQPLTGAAAFTLAAGATLGICDAAGINLSGATGAVHTTGARSFSPDALYRYNGTVAQATGNALPATVRSLTLANGAGLTLTQPVEVTQALALAAGTLTTTAAHHVTLGATATLVETKDAYVTGTVETTRNLNTAGLAQTFGGLGLTLTPSGATLPGSTTVRRLTGTPRTGVLGRQSIARSYDITAAVNTGLNVALTFGYFDHELNGIAESNLALFRSVNGPGGPWANQTLITRDASANTVTKTGVSGFSIWTLGDALAPLPVELSAFTATTEDPAVVRLAWATASEKNSDRFEVERSNDGTAFRRIATVAAAGSSSTRRTYALHDTSPTSYHSTLYYRLRQVDMDGTFAYSPVRAVTMGGTVPAGLMLTPNPGRATTLSGATAGEVVTVSDALSRLVLTATADADGTARLVLPAGLPMGMYLVRTGTRAVRLVVE